MGVGDECFYRILGSCCFHFSWGGRLKNLLEKCSVAFDPEGGFPPKIFVPPAFFYLLLLLYKH